MQGDKQVQIRPRCTLLSRPLLFLLADNVQGVYYWGFFEVVDIRSRRGKRVLLGLNTRTDLHSLVSRAALL